MSAVQINMYQRGYITAVSDYMFQHWNDNHVERNEIWYRISLEDRTFDIRFQDRQLGHVVCHLFDVKDGETDMDSETYFWTLEAGSNAKV